jgi:16S rRNA (guanine966-N2)-methyltransferase
MRTQLRIVAGSLKGRKLNCEVSPTLRPTPQMVREALFSILGNAVPDRPFYDVFAGTGVVGLEAVSRGATIVTFVERDFRLLAELEQHIKKFGVIGKTRLARLDVYRWIDRFAPPAQPMTVFLSPPFADFDERLDELLELIGRLQERVAVDSVIVLQSEKTSVLDELREREKWDERHYGRNSLLFWVKEADEELPDQAADQRAEATPETS